MIYTLTLNPSMDYVVRLDRLAAGTINRSSEEEFYAGGKGINVSLVLAQLGMGSTATGFIGGFVGEAIEQALAKAGVAADFVRLDEGMSRVNIKIMAETETEINGHGPRVTEEDFARLLTKLDQVREGDTLVLAGSVPASLTEDTYARILRRLEWRNARVVVDAAGPLLLNCLAHRPFLIKPNREELSAIFGSDVSDDREMTRCAGELRRKGARNVLVSLGSDGAALYAEDGKIYRSGAVSGKAVNTVGAGDSMVAGFVAGFQRTGDYAFSLRLGAACGNATAFSPGLAGRDMINDMLARL